MYEGFFQLEKTPFSTVPDPNCVHLVGQHADAISGLAYGVTSRKGYLLLTGEAGLGKTTAVLAMEQLLCDANVQLSMVLNPILSASEFLEMVLLNFGFRDVPASKALRLKMLQEFLIRSDQDGKITALIVDEAHQLSAELLEEVRLLGNLEASDHKLLQIVLAGQNELNDRLNLPALWQLKQRIVVRMSLHRLDRPAVEQYLRFRWAKAGGKDPMPFTQPAVDAIAAWSLGIPRLINSICDNALLIAFSAATQTVDADLIREACVELDLPTPLVNARSPQTRGAVAGKPQPASSLSSNRPLSPIFPAAPAPRTVAEQRPEAVVRTAAAPQFWQYDRPAMRRKAADLVADQQGGIPYRALVAGPPVAGSVRNILGVAAGAVVLIAGAAYFMQLRPLSGSRANTEPTAPSVTGMASALPPVMPAVAGPAAAPITVVVRPQTAPAQFMMGPEQQRANLIQKVPVSLPAVDGQAPPEGNVRLTAVIGTNGLVKSLRVLGGPPELLQPAMDAVKQWRYKPMLVNGEPVEVVTEIDVDAGDH